MKKQNKLFGLIPVAYAVTPPSVEPLPGVSFDLYDTVLNVFNWALGFIGFVALGFLVWGGVSYMMAGGDDAKVTTARKIILNSIIGVIIVLISYGIITWLKTFVKGTI